MSGEAACDEDTKTQNSCKLREGAGTVLVTCTASRAWNTNYLLEAI